MPNHRPVFPPPHSEAVAASLESQREVVFRRAAPDAGLALPAAPSQTGTRAEITHTGIPPATQGASAAGRVPDARPNASGHPPEMPSETIQNQPAQRHSPQAIQDAMAAVIRAIETPAQQNQTRRADRGLAAEEIAARHIVAQELRPAKHTEALERREAMRVGPTQVPVRETARPAPE